MLHPNHLRFLRDKVGLSQAEVAEKLNIHQAEYSKIESGKRRVFKHITQLCEILNCTEKDILKTDLETALVSENIPVYALPTPTGDAINFDKKMTSTAKRPVCLDESINGFAMFNNGTCVEPRLKHGDFIYCDPDETAIIGDICAVATMRGNKLVAVVREFMGNDKWLNHQTELVAEIIEPYMVAPVLGVIYAR